MKKSKLILTVVVIFAFMGGVVAFKANNFLPNNVWTLLAGSKLTTTNVAGILFATTIPNCTLTNLATTNVGPIVEVWSTTTAANVTTLFTAPGQQPVIRTYPYCTRWFTRTVAADN